MEEREPFSLLRRAGLRSTPQRLAIVREVYARNHPSVGEVFDAVREEYPTIGLATVYNTLRAMTERGLVHELPFTDVTRFEVNTMPHANLVCRGCGAIEDFELEDDELMAALRSRVAGMASFRPETQRLDIYGLCRDCATV